MTRSSSPPSFFTSSRCCVDQCVISRCVCFFMTMIKTFLHYNCLNVAMENPIHEIKPASPPTSGSAPAPMNVNTIDRSLNGNRPTAQPGHGEPGQAEHHCYGNKERKTKTHYEAPQTTKDQLARTTAHATRIQSHTNKQTAAILDTGSNRHDC